VGDINSDGNQDLLVYEGTPLGTPWQLGVFLGNGDGTFQAQQIITQPVPTSAELGLVLGDYNRDGLLDTIFLSDFGMNVYLQQ
jgi:hypothetical protein